MMFLAVLTERVQLKPALIKVDAWQRGRRLYLSNSIFIQRLSGSDLSSPLHNKTQSSLWWNLCSEHIWPLQTKRNLLGFSDFMIQLRLKKRFAERFFRSPVQSNTFLCLLLFSESCGADVSLVWVWTFVSGQTLLPLLYTLRNKFLKEACFLLII